MVETGRSEEEEGLADRERFSGRVLRVAGEERKDSGEDGVGEGGEAIAGRSADAGRKHHAVEKRTCQWRRSFPAVLAPRLTGKRITEENPRGEQRARAWVREE